MAEEKNNETEKEKKEKTEKTIDLSQDKETGEAACAENENEPAEENADKPEEVPEEDKTDPRAEKGEKKDKKSEIKKLKTELDAAKKSLDETAKKLDEQTKAYGYLAAEYKNYKTRSEAEKEKIHGNAVFETLGGLLPIIDNLQIAAKYSAGDRERLADGLEMILSKLPDTLDKLGITPFGNPGDKFDPALHNAVMHVDDESLGEGEIVEVLQQGYKYGDRVLRYAMVKVAN